MTERVLGPTGSPRRRWTLFLPLVAVLALGLFSIAGAQAVHATGAFELDGNAVSGSGAGGAAPDDWDRVCREVLSTNCGTTDSTHGATAVSWEDDGALNATIFTGGGSKDPQNISDWAWKDEAGGLPDKDNLLHAFAARYSLTGTTPTGSCPNGTGGPGQPAYDASVKCEVIYFGSDRYDNSGDAHQAFWFLQDEVTLGTNKIGGGTGFDGVHTNDDLLVISNFSNGGTTSTIVVYEWDSACLSGVTKPVAGQCADANLRLLGSSDAALCGAALDDSDAFCGIVNPSNGTAAPWSYTDKSGNNTYLQGEFYEAGINLSTLGLAGKCFSSVVSETRASTSTTATLKDFVIDQFDVCAPGLTTQVEKAGVSFNGTVAPGTPVYDTATVQITGATSPADAAGSVSFYLCGPTTSATACSSATGTLVSTETLVDTSSPANANDGISGADSDPVNTATAKLASGYWCFAATANLSNYDDPTEFANATTECFRVADTTTTATAQKWTPNDSATITSAGGSTVGGSVTFTLYNNLTCTAGTADANVLRRETVTVSAGTASGTSFPTTNGDGTPATGLAADVSFDVSDSPVNVSWNAVFTSTDSNVGGSTSPCESSAGLTIDDDTSS